MERMSRNWLGVADGKKRNSASKVILTQGECFLKQDEGRSPVPTAPLCHLASPRDAESFALALSKLLSLIRLGGEDKPLPAVHGDMLFTE